MTFQLKHLKVNPWNGIVKYKNCYGHVGPYFLRSGMIYSGGLTEEERKRLEKELGYPAGHLDANSKFWETYGIKIMGSGSSIDMNTPEGELKYLYCKNHKRVANGHPNVTPNHDFVLINEDSDANEVNRLNKIRRDAMKEFDKMSLDDMRKALRIYGFRSDTMSSSLVENRLFAEVEKDPRKFFNLWINNNNKFDDFLLESAISKNIVRKNRNTYYYGTDVIGVSREDAIAFLQDKSNNDIKIAIEAEIKSKTVNEEPIENESKIIESPI